MVQIGRKLAPAALASLEVNKEYIAQRRKDGRRGKIFHPGQEDAKEVAALIAAGGVVVMPWGAESRRIMILVGVFDNPLATAALNEIKGRPQRQVLGIGCLPESTHYVAKTEESKPLVEAARRLLDISNPTKDHLNQVIGLLFENNSVGLLLMAQDSLPIQVTDAKPFGRTVLVLGASDWQDPNDSYNNTLWELSTRYGKVVAGTSANPTGKNVYSVAAQHQLYEEIGSRVDGFVVFNKIPPKSPKIDAAASSTVIDLTGEQPKLMRWGNQHPLSFRRFFPDLNKPNHVNKEAHAENIVGFIKRRLTK